MKTVTVYCDYPAMYRATHPVTVEAEDTVGACHTAILSANETDTWTALKREQRTYVSALAEGAGVDPWCFSPMELIPPSSPSPACSRMWRCSRAMPRHEARIWSTSSAFCSMPSMPLAGPRGSLPQRWRACVPRERQSSTISRDSSWAPLPKRSSKRGETSARRHLTPDSLPPEGCDTWAAARHPQPQKSGPSCRCAAARTTPVFAVSLRCAPVRAPLIRPPRRCASGGLAAGPDQMKGFSP